MGLTGRSLKLSLAAAAAVLAACQTAPAGQRESCPPPGITAAQLAQFRAAGFQTDNKNRLNAMALGLRHCLASTDPDLRDGLAYTGLSAMLRAGQLNPDTIKTLRSGLLEDLETTEDPAGVHRPFIILALAEVARADRVSPLFTADERNELVLAAASFLTGIRDYRGFDETEGWRHNVAHAADLVLQLSLNSNISTGQILELRGAITAQVAPDSGHFYIYGEPDRLARAVLYMALRNEISEENWTSWFEALAEPGPFASWDEIWTNQRGLARLHNTRAFARAILVTANSSEQTALKALVPGAENLLRALP